MDYEKKNKEVLAKARHYYLTGEGESIDVLKIIFPELAESEDERIRKDLIGFFKDGAFLYHKKTEIVAWLEKQGQVKDNDAFIEKACEWLEDNYPYYFETDIEQEFKKAMKGE